ncbi:MAG: restriction endonuclease subunit S [Deltaproteobacteria bacterium]
MGVKPGYKQTEVGVIPEEWEVQEFGSLYAEPSRNGIYKTAEFQGRGTRIVNMGEMFGFDFISDQEMSRVALSNKELLVSALQGGDLLFGRRSVVPAGAGKCSLVITPQEPLTFESSIIRVRLNQGEAYPPFFYHFFASSEGRSVMSSIVSGTNVKGIRASELRELEIPIPPISEQETIAGALEDMDALIGVLDRLIAKKRDLKQAAMQQLLTGQTRLPGFSAEWEVNRLEYLIELIPSGIYGDEKRRDGTMPCRVATTAHINENDAWNEKEMSVRYFSPEQIRKYLPTEGDLIVVKSSGSAEKIQSGKIGFVDKETAGKFLFSNFLMLLRPTSITPRFLYFYLCSYNVKKLLPMLVEASTYPNIRLDEYMNLEIPTPKPDEQTAIATVLSDMDAEIAALEARRDKTRALKQGMMQELLTGRTRLV